MADKLVTQVSQDQDPAKLAEQAKRQAELVKKQKEQEQAPTSAPAQSEEKQHQPNCCWRFFCCCFVRRKPSPKQPSSPPSSDGDAKTTENSIAKPSETLPESPTSQKFLMGPQASDCKGFKTLVLDLDETLVHSSFRPVPGPDFVISIELDGVTHRVYVQKRPGVDQFLEEVATKFEVVVFTASLDKYANPLLDILDPKGLIKIRLFREACVQHYGNYVKDLSLLGRRLQDTLIIDNSPFSYMFQPDNAIPCTSWFNDKADRELYDLLPFLLEQIAPCEDVAKVIAERKQLAVNSGGGVEVVGGEEEEEEAS